MECPTKSAECKNRYFTGMSSPVLFVAFMSAMAFTAIVSGALVVAVLQTFYFILLPLAAAASGAFLIARPEITPLGQEPYAQLLVPTVGALMLAYSGGALLVGATGYPKARSLHLGLMTAVLGLLALVSAKAGTVTQLEFFECASKAFCQMSFGAALGAVTSAMAPAVTKKIRAGKPGSPTHLMCSS